MRLSASDLGDQHSDNQPTYATVTLLTSEHLNKTSGETTVTRFKTSVLKKPGLSTTPQANSSEPDTIIPPDISKRTTDCGVPDFSKD